MNIETSDSSKDDPLRHELLWSSRQETLIVKWRQIAQDRAEAHSIKATNYKKLYLTLASVSIILPTVCSGVTQVYDPPWFLALGFMTTACLNGMQALLKWNNAYVQHNEFSAKYEDFGREMDCELNKPKAFRVACDVYTKTCEMRLNFLTRQAPDI